MRKEKQKPVKRGMLVTLGIELLRSFQRQEAGVLIGLPLLLLMSFMAIGGTFITPQNPFKQSLAHRLTPPFWEFKGTLAYPLGTDALGRDILSRIIVGARISLLISLAAVTLATVWGVTIGLLAGYLGGWLDKLFMRLADIQLAFPSILLALAILVMLGPGMINLVVVLALSRWVTFARVIRGEVLSLKTRDFVEAARAAGAQQRRVMLTHLLPNLLGSIIVLSTLALARIILSEASLSFLGLGVQPPTPTWGGMLSDGRKYLSQAWWVATFPGLAITGTVIGVNLFGDWLRDKLDPRLRESST
jgi:peptide/nickel transport system permease protein